jgi:hypothetical protein
MGIAPSALSARGRRGAPRPCRSAGRRRSARRRASPAPRAAYAAESSAAVARSSGARRVPVSAASSVTRPRIVTSLCTSPSASASSKPRTCSRRSAAPAVGSRPSA